MTKTRLKGLVSVFTGILLSLSVTQVQAASILIIDDFNINTISSVTDNVVGTPVTGPSTIDGANIVMGGASGWTRTLSADLTAGIGMTTRVCNSCLPADGHGHVFMDAGNSNGIGIYTYAGPAIDLSAFTGLYFDWGADLAGASVDIIIKDGTNTSTAASWSSLAATGGSAPLNLVTQSTMAINWGSVNSSAVTELQFVVTGVDNIDSIIDNVTAVVPIPAAVWLFGSGLLGLVGIARRKKA